MRDASQVAEQACRGVATLDHVHTGQRNEGQPDDEMRPPLRGRRRSGQRGRERHQQAEVDREAGSRAAPLGRCSARWRRRIPAGHSADVAAKGQGSYSIGRFAMADGSRPASSHPTAAATSGMAITMRNRLLHGT